MDAKYEEIMLGVPICIKLRDIYFRDVPWADCYKQVSERFSALKSVALKFYADKTGIEVLKELILYNHQDIMDVFDHG